MSDDGISLITEWQFQVLSALKEATDHPEGPGYNQTDNKRGWFLATQLVDKKLLSGSNIRPALELLCSSALVERTSRDSGRYFRITKGGIRRLERGITDSGNKIIIDSSNWTGIIEPVKVFQAMAIVHEMEDVCENIKNNHDRAQIFGLIRALDVLLNVPEPPRQGIVGLIRDPAFANIVQIATFLAALIGAVKP